MKNNKHITIFDKPYPLEKQAEGIAVSEAVVEGHCEKCGFLKRCSTDETFIPPVFAWCARRKNEIVSSLRKGVEAVK